MTQIARERELAELADHQNKILGIVGASHAAELAIRQGQPLRGNTTNNSNTTTINDNRSLAMNLQGGGAAIIEQMMERVALNTMQRVRYR
jgi:hypothetical protein